MASFWQRYARGRLRRRRFLVGSASTVAGAAFLAACGGDDSDAPEDSTGGGATGATGTGAASGLEHVPVETTDQATQGGTLQTFGAQPPHLDPLTIGILGDIVATANFAYPKMLKGAITRYPDAATDDAIEGDLATDWEFNEDQTRLTMHLREGLKWDLPSGREIDAQDVVWSWNKFSSLSPYAGNIAYSINPLQPVEAVTEIDSRTVVFELAFPDPSILGMLTQNSIFMVAPREGESEFDPELEVHGYGPFHFLEDYEPDVGMTWRRNPDYYVQDRPFIEEFRVNIVPEYASRLSQFRAGNLYESVANIDDVLPTKRELPETLLLVNPTHTVFNSNAIIFSWDEGSPWIDQRVRQAIAYLVDRDDFRDFATNEQAFLDEGIPRSVRAFAHVPPGWADHWLDPLDEGKFGPNAKFYQHNVAEARKLLEAAGHPDGFETMLFSLGADAPTILAEQVREVGIEAVFEQMDGARWFETIGNAYNLGENSGFGSTGFAVRTVTNYVDAATTIATMDQPGARSFHGGSPDGSNPHQGDPELTEVFNAFRFEFDRNRSIEAGYEYQRLAIEKAYRIPMWWSAPAVSLTWPVIGNHGVFRRHPRSVGVPATGAPAVGINAGEDGLHLWIDDSKPPLA